MYVKKKKNLIFNATEEIYQRVILRLLRPVVFGISSQCIHIEIAFIDSLQSKFFKRLSIMCVQAYATSYSIAYYRGIHTAAGCEGKIT